MSKKLILASLAANLNSLVPQSDSGAFVPMDGPSIFRTLRPSCWLGPRDLLEKMPHFRQIIPYVVLMVGDKIIRYKRTPAGGEPALHDLASIGFGGHIDLSDVVSEDSQVWLPETLAHAASREVEEELPGTRAELTKWVGLLIDNSNDVGRVHLGVVAIWHLDSITLVTPTDASISCVELVELTDLHMECDKLESWSRMLVEYFAINTP